MPDTLEYEYQYTVARLVVGVLITAAAAGGMGYLAHTNDAGLSFKHIVTLSPDAASIVYWMLAFICGALAAALVFLLFSGVTKSVCKITLTPTEFSAPQWSFLKKDNLTVPYSAIKGIYIQRGPSRFLHVHTTMGKTVINESDVGKQAFEQILAVLSERVPKHG